jgi:hypothetical protein
MSGLDVPAAAAAGLERGATRIAQNAGPGPRVSTEASGCKPITALVLVAGLKKGVVGGKAAAQG